MTNTWLEQARKRLKQDRDQENGVAFERLQALGMINDRGEVTGKLRRWNAFLAITEVKRAPGQPLIQQFRCLKPVFGMPGGALIDVSRASMVDYLKAGKKVITAHRDDRLNIWIEDCEVHFSENGFVRCDLSAEKADDVGSLPEYRQSTSRL